MKNGFKSRYRTGASTSLITAVQNADSSDARRGLRPFRRTLRRARRRRAWGIFPGDPGVVPDIFNAVSTPHISLHVRLPSLPFLHTFCTLSARAAQRSLSGEYALYDLLSDLSMVVA